MACRTTVGVYLRQTCPGAGRERRGETPPRVACFFVLVTLMSYVESGDARRVLLPFADGIGFAPRGDRAPDGRPTATAAAPADRRRFFSNRMWTCAAERHLRASLHSSLRAVQPISRPHEVGPTRPNAVGRYSSNSSSTGVTVPGDLSRDSIRAELPSAAQKVTSLNSARCQALWVRSPFSSCCPRSVDVRGRWPLGALSTS